MPRPKPNKLYDELDALLGGGPVELTDELAPLAEVADALRAELAAFELDPAVADRHLEWVLDDSAMVVRLPVRSAATGWELRRRAVAVVLAAALVLAPATMASAAALPGQAMYPFKRAIEQLRIVSVQWSPGREAVERTRVANERLSEVQRLAELKMFNQLPTAINALTKAVIEAQEAVDDAREDGEPVPKAAAELNRVKVVGGVAVRQAVAAAAKASVPVPTDTMDAIQKAVDDSTTVLPPALPAGATPTPTSTPTTVATLPEPNTDPTSGSGAVTTQPVTPGGSPETTQTTPPPTTDAPTTTTTATTTPPPTSEPEATLGSPEDQPAEAGIGGQAGGDERSLPQAVPPTTVPVTVP